MKKTETKKKPRMLGEGSGGVNRLNFLKKSKWVIVFTHSELRVEINEGFSQKGLLGDGFTEREMGFRREEKKLRSASGSWFRGLF